MTTTCGMPLPTYRHTVKGHPPGALCHDWATVGARSVAGDRVAQQNDVLTLDAEKCLPTVELDATSTV